MKVTIPEQLKSDVPQSTFGKILAATPVAMAVVATMLAGLSSSEMTRAQYDRSLAAQEQSKAGDQWSFFQAKKLRGAMQRSTLDLLQATTDVHPVNTAALGEMSPEVKAALEHGEVPALPKPPEFDPRVKAALNAMESQKSDAEILAALTNTTAKVLDDSIRMANDAAIAFDAETSPVNKAIDQAEKKFSSDKNSSRDFAASRMRYTAARYDAESRLNQTIANLYELEVRRSNESADHHHQRSQRFFFGMLAAQLGVIVSTFAMAARAKNLLWSIAAGAGIIALGLAVWVYFYV
jgi:hypothetical protein